jgi:ubiquinone/menaquinone biosynthesis C-methylase UbiE
MLNQLRRPTGTRGEAIATVMNRTHSLLTDWALEHVTIAETDIVLDIGCGGGRTVQKLAALATQGRIRGIDYSEASVSVARKSNADSIATGRVAIDLGSVAALPYADRTFDVVTAIETHYYWRDLDSDLREVLRVVKPGGAFLIVAEAYRRRRLPTPSSLIMRALRAHYLSVEEHAALLAKAGFTDVLIVEDRPRGWLCAIARRP